MEYVHSVGLHFKCSRNVHIFGQLATYILWRTYLFLADIILSLPLQGVSTPGKMKIAWSRWESIEAATLGLQVQCSTELYRSKSSESMCLLRYWYTTAVKQEVQCSTELYRSKSSDIPLRSCRQFFSLPGVETQSNINQVVIHLSSRPKSTRLNPVRPTRTNLGPVV